MNFNKNNTEQKYFFNKVSELSYKRSQSVPWNILASPFYNRLDGLFSNEIVELGFFKRKSSLSIFLKKLVLIGIISLIGWAIVSKYSLIEFLIMFGVFFIMYLFIVPSGMFDNEKEIFLRRKEIAPRIINQLNDHKRIFTKRIEEDKQLKIGIQTYNAELFKTELLKDTNYIGKSSIDLLNEDQLKELFEDEQERYIKKYEQSIQSSEKFIQYLDEQIQFLETIK